MPEYLLGMSESNERDRKIERKRKKKGKTCADIYR